MGKKEFDTPRVSSGAREYDIATAKTRLAKEWKNRKVTWEQFVKKCSKTKRTGETLEQYARMSKNEQSGIKDVGGFVGGYLNDGARRKGYVAHRSMITLDIDNGTPNLWEDFTLQYSCAALLYSTHKHTPETPRYRLIIPLKRDVTCEEYEPVCRRITASLGIDLFDRTTYELQRLFYWPSTSSDGEFVFERQDGEPLDPDGVLSTYKNWLDRNEWPRGSSEDSVTANEKRKAGEPTEKPGLVGAFCRVYTIEDALEKFLGDVYEPTATPGRYTYKQGSVAGGLVCYDGKWAYSNHSTDPTSRQLCNAFDLVRIHLFGDSDKSKDYADVTKRPSYKKMEDFAAKDETVRRLINQERVDSAKHDFANIGDASAEGISAVMEKLECDRKGKPLSTGVNALTILENDPGFKGKLYQDGFRGAPMVSGPLPWKKQEERSSYPRRWRDADNAGLRLYMEKMYSITGKDKIRDAKDNYFDAHTRHPVREYLEGLRWDGVPRLDKLVIDYLGAEDTPLTCSVTRVWMTGAVSRIFKPGCKFDYCLILVGAQGIGKSTFFEILAGEWYNGNLSAMSSERASLEQLRGSWIFELQELDGMKRREASQVKAFITNRIDKYRGAYKEETEEFPRQCVFGGTTNEAYFLKDDTGERRFWPVEVSSERQRMGDPREALTRDRDQIWAEAVQAFRDGQTLRLSPEFEAEMMERCKAYSFAELDSFSDDVSNYLDTLLPVDWAAYTLDQRRHYYKDGEGIKTKGLVSRTEAHAMSFIHEYYGKERGDEKYKGLAAKFNTIMEKEHSKEWKKSRLSMNSQIDRELYKSRQAGWAKIWTQPEDDL